MSAVGCELNGESVAAGVSMASVPAAAQTLHRIREVRQEQGVSVRTAARRLGLDATEVSRQEQETSDLPLSALYQWQDALEVPVAQLLVEDGDPLSAPILKRARLVRIMKTAAALQEVASTESEQRLATRLVDQLTEMMPELEAIGPWHAVGQRRTREEYGRTAEQPLSADLFREGRRRKG